MQLAADLPDRLLQTVMVMVTVAKHKMSVPTREQVHSRGIINIATVNDGFWRRFRQEWPGPFLRYPCGHASR
jgi:hypothetical protein